MGSDVALSWSGGKDSALTLAELTAAGMAVRALLVTDTGGQVTMHGVPIELVQRQADALGLPLYRVRLPAEASNTTYESAMAGAITTLGEAGISRLAFGDVHLAEVRAYRERRLSGLGAELLFPLWHRNTGELMRTLLARRHRAVVACVDLQQLDASFCGRQVDERFLAELPNGVDPAGEHGEYHTFVTDGPDFAEPVPVRLGPCVTHEGRFRYQTLEAAPG
ncbi:ATP-binding protein [Haloechinothrix sp. LS1_15]|uniref:Dph6-related ATP pyrophosphatase n=1 Tax=Haloechinothrix sp. LS1_15 TaxID=2652248 RepID=UPI00294662F2|nr:ATP-binding protein [Haloechinothrix sp. LS1_15]MDV6014077.1 adenine nucleotide alpha hydrolase [Haloechinothrix sp. LS1_15]